MRLQYPASPLEIEIVLKYSYEFPGAESRVRKAFGQEVSRVCKNLSQSADWRLEGVTVGDPDFQWGRKSLAVQPNEIHYTQAQIVQDPAISGLMQQSVGKLGFAQAQCAVALPEEATVLSMRLLNQVFERVNLREGRQGNEDYDATSEDKERVCGGSETAAVVIQEYLRKRNVQVSLILRLKGLFLYTGGGVLFRVEWCIRRL